MKRSIFIAAFMLCLVSTVTFGQTRSLTFTNNTGMTLSGIYLEPSGVTGATWSPNIWTNTDSRFMNSTNYPYVQTYDNTYTGCLYDIKYTGDDGKDYYMKSVDLCGTTPIIFSIPSKMTK